MRVALPAIDKNWTLFLDRDGVINYEKHADYIHTWDEFRFYEAALDAFKIFPKIFQRTIVVTNQKGVGKGLTKLEDLYQIHANMEHAVMEAGGLIDAVYYCSDMDDNSPFRKPNPGMGYEAIKRFPEIDPRRSLMVGNTISDMEFGRNLGAFTVFLSTTRPEVDHADPRIDAVFPSLMAFAEALPAGKL
ncbi:MAG: family hydrolase [Ferruginibacter sp.]|nr:family hydrolase [Ferruginibacter sp.]